MQDEYPAYYNRGGEQMSRVTVTITECLFLLHVDVISLSGPDPVDFAFINKNNHAFTEYGPIVLLVCRENNPFETGYGIDCFYLARSPFVWHKTIPFFDLFIRFHDSCRDYVRQYFSHDKNAEDKVLNADLISMQRMFQRRFRMPEHEEPVSDVKLLALVTMNIKFVSYAQQPFLFFRANDLPGSYDSFLAYEPNPVYGVIRKKTALLFFFPLLCRDCVLFDPVIKLDTVSRIYPVRIGYIFILLPQVRPDI